MRGGGLCGGGQGLGGGGPKGRNRKERKWETGNRLWLWGGMRRVGSIGPVR